MLDGAKILCLLENGEPYKTIEAKGKKFSIGYLMDCDHIIENVEAEKIHCQIECDAFGHVTIYNKSQKNPISVNGETVTIKRTLFNNSKIKILDKEYLWQHKNSTCSFDAQSPEGVSTPTKQIIPEQPPNSCPSLKPNREVAKRFTVHNLRAYRVDTGANVTTEIDESSSQEESSPTENATFELDTTPAKVDLVDSTNDKKTSSTEKRMKAIRCSFGWSGITTTSYSPRETGVRTEKTFTAIIPPKNPRTPICRTPKGLLESIHLHGERNDTTNPELLSFATPSKKPDGQNNSEIIVQHARSAMKIVDLTTPSKLFTRSISTKKPTVAKSLLCDKTNSKSNLSLSTLPTTPKTTHKLQTNQTPSSTSAAVSTASSVITVDSSSESDISEETDASAVTSTTPLRSQLPTSSVLRKQVLLASAKKQVAIRTMTTPHSSEATAQTATQAEKVKDSKSDENVISAVKKNVARRLDVLSTEQQPSTPVSKTICTSTITNTKIQEIKLSESTLLPATSTPYKTTQSVEQQNESTQQDTGIELFRIFQSSNNDGGGEPTTNKEHESESKERQKSLSANDELLKEIEEILSTSDDLKKQLKDEINSIEPTPSNSPTSLSPAKPTSSNTPTSQSPAKSTAESSETITDVNKTPGKNSISASIILKAISTVEMENAKTQKEDEEKENNRNECASNPSSPALRRTSLSSTTPSVAEVTTAATGTTVTATAFNEENSIASVTPLTPKHVSIRKISLSGENEDNMAINTSSHQNIDVFNTENMGAIIEDETESDSQSDQSSQTPPTKTNGDDQTPMKMPKQEDSDVSSIPETPMQNFKEATAIKIADAKMENERLETERLETERLENEMMSPLHCSDESFAELVMFEEQQEPENITMAGILNKSEKHEQENENQTAVVDIQQRNDPEKQVQEVHIPIVEEHRSELNAVVTEENKSEGNEDINECFAVPILDDTSSSSSSDLPEKETPKRSITVNPTIEETKSSPQLFDEVTDRNKSPYQMKGDSIAGEQNLNETFEVNQQINEIEKDLVASDISSSNQLNPVETGKEQEDSTSDDDVDEGQCNRSSNEICKSNVDVVTENKAAQSNSVEKKGSTATEENNECEESQINDAEILSDNEHLTFIESDETKDHSSQDETSVTEQQKITLRNTIENSNEKSENQKLDKEVPLEINEENIFEVKDENVIESTEKEESSMEAVQDIQAKESKESIHNEENKEIESIADEALAQDKESSIDKQTVAPEETPFSIDRQTDAPEETPFSTDIIDNTLKEDDVQLVDDKKIEDLENLITDELNEMEERLALNESIDNCNKNEEKQIAETSEPMSELEELSGIEESLALDDSVELSSEKLNDKKEIEPEITTQTKEDNYPIEEESIKDAKNTDFEVAEVVCEIEDDSSKQIEKGISKETTTMGKDNLEISKAENDADVIDVVPDDEGKNIQKIDENVEPTPSVIEILPTLSNTLNNESFKDDEILLLEESLEVSITATNRDRNQQPSSIEIEQMFALNQGIIQPIEKLPKPADLNQSKVERNEPEEIFEILSSSESENEDDGEQLQQRQSRAADMMKASNGKEQEISKSVNAEKQRSGGSSSLESKVSQACLDNIVIIDDGSDEKEETSILPQIDAEEKNVVQKDNQNIEPKDDDQAECSSSKESPTKKIVKDSELSEDFAQTERQANVVKVSGDADDVVVIDDGSSNDSEENPVSNVRSQNDAQETDIESKDEKNKSSEFSSSNESPTKLTADVLEDLEQPERQVVVEKSSGKLDDVIDDLTDEKQETRIVINPSDIDAKEKDIRKDNQEMDQIESKDDDQVMNSEISFSSENSQISRNRDAEMSENIQHAERETIKEKGSTAEATRKIVIEQSDGNDNQAAETAMDLQEISENIAVSGIVSQSENLLADSVEEHSSISQQRDVEQDQGQNLGEVKTPSKDSEEQVKPIEGIQKEIEMEKSSLEISKLAAGNEEKEVTEEEHQEEIVSQDITTSAGVFDKTVENLEVPNLADTSINLSDNRNDPVRSLGVEQNVVGEMEAIENPVSKLDISMADQVPQSSEDEQKEETKCEELSTTTPTDIHAQAIKNLETPDDEISKKSLETSTDKVESVKDSESDEEKNKMQNTTEKMILTLDDGAKTLKDSNEDDKIETLETSVRSESSQRDLVPLNVTGIDQSKEDDKKDEHADSSDSREKQESEIIPGKSTESDNTHICLSEPIVERVDESLQEVSQSEKIETEEKQLHENKETQSPSEPLANEDQISEEKESKTSDMKDDTDGDKETDSTMPEKIEANEKISPIVRKDVDSSTVDEALLSKENSALKESDKNSETIASTSSTEEDNNALKAQIEDDKVSGEIKDIPAEVESKDLVHKSGETMESKEQNPRRIRQARTKKNVKETEINVKESDAEVEKKDDHSETLKTEIETKRPRRGRKVEAKSVVDEKVEEKTTTKEKETKTEEIVETVEKEDDHSKMVKTKTPRRIRQVRAKSVVIEQEEVEPKNQMAEESKKVEAVEEAAKEDTKNISVDQSETMKTETEAAKRPRRMRQVRAKSIVIEEESEQKKVKKESTIEEEEVGEELEKKEPHTETKKNEKEIKTPRRIRQVRAKSIVIEEVEEQKAIIGEESKMEEKQGRSTQRKVKDVESLENIKNEVVKNEETIEEINEEPKKETAPGLTQETKIKESVETNEQHKIMDITQNPDDESKLDVSPQRSLRRRAAVQNYEISSDSENDTQHTSSRKRRLGRTNQKQAKPSSSIDTKEETDTAANTAKTPIQRSGRKKQPAAVQNEAEKQTEDEEPETPKKRTRKKAEPKTISKLISELMPHDTIESKDLTVEKEELPAKAQKGRKAPVRSGRAAAAIASKHIENVEKETIKEKEENMEKESEPKALHEPESLTRQVPRRGVKKTVKQQTEEVEAAEELEMRVAATPKRTAAARKAKTTKAHNDSYLYEEPVKKSARGKKAAAVVVETNETATTVTVDNATAQEEIVKPKTAAKRKPPKSAKEESSTTTTTSEHIVAAEIPVKRSRRHSVQSEPKDDTRPTAIADNEIKPSDAHVEESKKLETTRTGRQRKLTENESEAVITEKRRKVTKAQDSTDVHDDLATETETTAPSKKTTRGRATKQKDATVEVTTTGRRKQTKTTQKDIAEVEESETEKTAANDGELESDIVDKTSHTQVETSTTKRRGRAQKQVNATVTAAAESTKQPATPQRSQRRKHVRFDEQPPIHVTAEETEETSPSSADKKDEIPLESKEAVETTAASTTRSKRRRK